MVYLYIIVVLLMAGIEGKPMVRDKKWAELAVFSFLTVAGAAVLIYDTAVFDPYRVSMILDLIFRPYTDLFESFLTSF